MSDATEHRVAYQNADFRSEVRFVDEDTLEPWTLVAGHMRAVMTVDGEEVELFDVVPTQDVDGWVTGFVPESTMALAPAGVGQYDMILEFENEDRLWATGGTLHVKPGISQW